MRRDKKHNPQARELVWDETRIQEDKSPHGKIVRVAWEEGWVDCVFVYFWDDEELVEYSFDQLDGNFKETRYGGIWSIDTITVNTGEVT